MHPTKLTYSLLFVALVVILVAFLWRYDFLLVAALLVTLYLKHRYIPLKKELFWFVITGFIGAFGESLIMLRGPWAYSSALIFNFPIWLPLVWGLAGTIGVSLYRSIENS